MELFASIWVARRKSVQKLKEGETASNLFAFMTTESYAEVNPFIPHPKAMPVIQTKLEDWNR